MSEIYLTCLVCDKTAIAHKEKEVLDFIRKHNLCKKKEEHKDGTQQRLC